MPAVFPTFDPVSPQALAISHLLIALLIIMGGVFLLVAVWIVVNIVRFRARPNTPEPAQYYGSTRLEIIWTVVPALLLVVIFGITLRTMGEADPPIFAPDASAAVRQQQRTPDLTIVGHQFFWEIRYPQGFITDDELHLPVGKRLYVQLQSVDVVHSFWLPQVAGKVDVVPGQLNYIWLEADKPGTYIGQCAEFCGTAHAWMRIVAIAQSPADYAAWLQQQAQPAKEPTSGAAAAGYQLFMNGTCRNCHAIAGTPAGSDIGPNLTHFASRTILGGGVLTNTPANLRAWLTDPQAVKPGNNMPDFYLNSQQVSLLAAYLETLK
jgi:cytochrome c oxidase subunit II